jgi:hypothetical protein
MYVGMELVILKLLIPSLTRFHVRTGTSMDEEEVLANKARPELSDH